MRKSYSGGGLPDFARLELFCELVDEYDELAAAFPIEQPGLQIVPAPTASAVDRWARLVRAMALRKFALAVQDDVYIPTVFDAFERCLTDPAKVQDIRGARTRFDDLGGQITIHEGPAPDDERTAPRIIRDFIYGGFLHGDYEKHQRVKLRPDVTHDLSLWLFTTDVEQFMRRMRSLIRGSMDDGTLVDPRDAGRR